MPSSNFWLRRLERVLTAVVQTLTVLSAVVMILSLLVGVFFRYVMQDSLTWSEEVAMLCFSWLIFLAAALMVRENGHVRMELIEPAMSAKAYGLLNQFIWILIAMIGGYMAWTGFQFIQLTMGQSSPAIRYPIWMRDISLPIGGILITFYALLNLCAKPDGQTSESAHSRVTLES
ncbi:TRAP transporter small permease [Pusillimonas sp. ANT_WB101]|uniref:TRAP transporter small permease n=1 Tax=Pusillimonas sp. ANT_WB101 TaxID=2597356 RepID=UPI0011EBBD77|nr:TRAP transporter small permease [Pusillimonas sp. ANT_WB101]KAA0890910.1 TRAP transporter small permease [Pusillimonas sp. ANT_WB101]